VGDARRLTAMTARALGVLSLGACGGLGGSGGPLHAEAPTQPTEQSKCKIAASHENPLVTEWPASEKANLEARLREGGVVVAYSGCSMKLLPQCRVKGSYGWRRTTTATDVIEVHDADELYAKLPLGAVSLEGELERSGRIAVQTTVSGQMELRGWDKWVPTDPACAGATHVMGALSIGAFKLRSGGAVSAGGGVGVAGVGSGSAATSSSENVIREAGSPDACKGAGDDAPNPECASPVQVFLWPLPKTLTDRGAPGTVKVSFLSATSDRTWDVTVNDRVICKTPCSRWVDPAIPYGFTYDPGILQRNEHVDAPDLREHQAEAPLQVAAHPQQTGKFVGGIVMTTFGGLATAAGITLLAVGCPSTDHKGLCTAGAITLPAGLGLMIPGILFITSSGAYADVRPSGEPAPPTGPTSRTWGVGYGRKF
jgi:hypothetical protein